MGLNPSKSQKCAVIRIRACIRTVKSRPHTGIPRPQPRLHLRAVVNFHTSRNLKSPRRNAPITIPRNRNKGFVVRTYGHSKVSKIHRQTKPNICRSSPHPKNTSFHIIDRVAHAVTLNPGGLPWGASSTCAHIDAFMSEILGSIYPRTQTSTADIDYAHDAGKDSNALLR